MDLGPTKTLKKKHLPNLYKTESDELWILIRKNNIQHYIYILESLTNDSVVFIIDLF